MDFAIRQPETDTDFKACFQLRWKILRAPWRQPPGSERDDLEDSAFHLMAQDKMGKVVGVARLHWNSPDEAQIRYMAVEEHARHQGVGRHLLEELEAEAMRKHAQAIVLHARESVTGFYEANGYQLLQPSHLLFDEIPHYLMRKPMAK